MKNKRVHILFGILVISVIITSIFVFFYTFIIPRDGDPIKIYKDQEIHEEIKVSFNNFKPGDEEKYTLKFIGQYSAIHSINFDFIETNNGKLKDFLIVEIKINDDKICTYPLKELLNGDKRISLEKEILEKEILYFEVSYKMPVTVGNEAQNTKGSYNIIITINEL